MALPRPGVARPRRLADDVCVTVRPILPVLRRRLRRLREERGITLIELLTAMAIMLIVISTIAGVFVSGSNAEIDLRNRFEAQTNARSALDKFRREVHNACRATVTGLSGGRYTSVTLWKQVQNPAFTCDPGAPSATWCVVGTAAPYTLHRQNGATCSAAGVSWARHLVTKGAFLLIASSTQLLPRVDVDFTIDLKLTDDVPTPRQRYALRDAIALRSYHRS